MDEMSERHRKIGAKGILWGSVIALSSLGAAWTVNYCSNPHRNDDSVLRVEELRSDLRRMNENKKLAEFYKLDMRRAQDELSSLENSDSVIRYREWAAGAARVGLSEATVGVGIVALTMIGMGLYAAFRKKEN